MKSKRIFHLFINLVLSFILFSCAPPAIKTTTLVPARFHEATKLKEIAVLPFDGPGGRDFAAEIEGTLASVNIDDKQYFTLVDRTKIEKVLSEQALSQTGVIDEATAAKVGKLVGAKGIYTGTVTARNVRDNHYSEKRQTCIKKAIEYDNKGRAYEGRCIQYKDYFVSCTRRDSIFAFTPKLIQVETGKIIYSNNLSGTATSSACSDSSEPLASEVDLLEKAKEAAKTAFKRDVAPNYVTLEVNLMESTDDIPSKEGKQKMEKAIDFAKHNRLDRACELWGEARILSPNSASLLYNLGVCAEVRGDFDNALELYKKADKALNKPDDRITAGIVRVSEAIKKQKVLKDQLASISSTSAERKVEEPPQPKAAAPLAAPVEPQPKTQPVSPPSELAPKKSQAPVEPQPISTMKTETVVADKPPVKYLIIIKNANVRSEANVKSKIITTLKKGEKVQKLGKLNNWFNVKLPTGQTGWIFKDLVEEVE